MPVIGVGRFQRFFRLAAGLDVDKDDLKRYSDFVNQKVYDLLVVAQAAAKANGRDLIMPSDLPITRGLRQSIRDFDQVQEEVDLEPSLQRPAVEPALDLSLAVETEAELPAIVGGLSLALARTFQVLDPEVRNPQTRQWERALRIFDLLL
jgi:hypothetical protein